MESINSNAGTKITQINPQELHNYIRQKTKEEEKLKIISKVMLIKH